MLIALCILTGVLVLLLLGLGLAGTCIYYRHFHTRFDGGGTISRTIPHSIPAGTGKRSAFPADVGTPCGAMYFPMIPPLRH